ncbi:MAG: DNA methyltransferase [Candidatus Altiarchaeota archaeon]
MKFILQLSGEHPTLPLAELKAVLDGQMLEYDVRTEGRLAFVKTVDEGAEFVSRLAYTLSAAEEVSVARGVDGLAADIYDSICEAPTFRVTGSQKVQKRLGDLLTKFGMVVDLKNPAAEVLVYETGGGYVAGLRIKAERGYQLRRAQYRPYFHPTSMHPKLARALVNLSRVSSDDTVLDPFCGTGGVLIEAGLMGIGLCGWDIDPKMVEGCRQNLGEFGLAGEVSVNDALKGRGSADAIATDPPYGRSSYSSEDPGRLYGKFLSNARAILDGGCFMALMAPSDREISSGGFKAVETFDVYIHKSLTRRIWVLEAI